MQDKVREKKRIALSSVAAAIALTGFKLFIGLETNSLGILSEAAHSGLDLLAALITYIAVSIADKPADRDHHFGHGKVENVSAFVETFLLFITCGWIIWEAISRLISKQPHIDASIWGFIVIIFAIIVDISRSRALYRVARKYNSQALEADALHFSSDIWSSVVVLGGLVFVRLGVPWMDSLAAIIVAIIVLFVTYRLGLRTIDALTDRVPKGTDKNILDAAGSVTGVESIKNVRIRPSGSSLFVDLTIAIRRITPFYQAHNIMDNVEKTINKIYPNADTIVHAEPCTGKDETIAEKVRMIVIGSGLPEPHNLRIHRIDHKYQVDFHIEHQKGMTLGEAHQITAEIEKRISDEMGTDTIVTIHMEELCADEEKLVDVTSANNAMVDEIRRFVLSDSRVLECKDVMLLKFEDKFNLSLTCLFSRTSPLGQVHRLVDEIELKLRDRFATLNRITIHSEPA